MPCNPYKNRYKTSSLGRQMGHIFYTSNCNLMLFKILVRLLGQSQLQPVLSDLSEIVSHKRNSVRLRLLGSVEPDGYCSNNRFGYSAVHAKKRKVAN